MILASAGCIRSGLRAEQRVDAEFIFGNREQLNSLTDLQF
jgi:hypothetical protein